MVKKNRNRGGLCAAADAPLGLLPRSLRSRSRIQAEAVHMLRVYIPLSCRIDPCWARKGVPSVRNGAAKNWRESASPLLLRSPQAPPSHSQSIPCRMLCTGRLCTSCRRRKGRRGWGPVRIGGRKTPRRSRPPRLAPLTSGSPSIWSTRSTRKECTLVSHTDAARIRAKL